MAEPTFTEEELGAVRGILAKLAAADALLNESFEAASRNQLFELATALLVLHATLGQVFEVADAHLGEPEVAGAQDASAG